MIIKINPISVNKCWQGRRFKTKEYKEWRELFYYLTPRIIKPLKTKIQLSVSFWIKNVKMADLDNLLKPFIDALVECGYLEDDKQIISIRADKNYIKEKEKEYIDFELFEL